MTLYGRTPLSPIEMNPSSPSAGRPVDQAAVTTSELLRRSSRRDARHGVVGLLAGMNQGWSTIELKLEMLPA
jgi:hypothetical protein